MKTRKRAVFFMAMTALVLICTCFAGCENGSKNEESQSQQEQKVKEKTPVVSLKTIVIGDYSDVEKKVITQIFPNTEFSTNLSAVNESYKIVINDLEDLPDNIADDAYYILYDIQENEEIEDVLDDRNDEFWEGIWNEETEEMVKERLQLCPYAFIGYNPAHNARIYISSISTQNQWEAVINDYNNHIEEHGGNIELNKIDIETFFVEDENALLTNGQNEINEEVCIMRFSDIAHWILNCEESQSKEARVAARSAIERAVKSGDDPEVKIQEVASSYSITRVDQLEANIPIPRKGVKDTISGKGSIGITIAYTPFLITNSNSSGLYYAVNMQTSIANANMIHYFWTSKTKGGQVAGFYMKEVSTTVIPIVKTKTGELLEVTFPVGCSPVPKTSLSDVNKTEEHGYKWNIGGEVKVGYKNGSKSGFDVSGTVKGGVEFSNSTRTTWTSKDVNFINKSYFMSNPYRAIAEGSIVVGNLPEWKDREFSRAPLVCEGTQDVNSTWLWYIPGDFKEDGSNLPKVTFHVDVIPKYGASWHWHETASNVWTISPAAYDIPIN